MSVNFLHGPPHPGPFSVIWMQMALWAEACIIPSSAPGGAAGPDFLKSAGAWTLRAAALGSSAALEGPA